MDEEKERVDRNNEEEYTDNESNEIYKNQEEFIDDDVITVNDEQISDDDEKDYEEKNDIATTNEEDDNKKYKNKFTIKNNKKLSICIIGILIISYIIMNNVVDNYDNISYPKSYIYTKDISKLSEKELIKEISNAKEKISKNEITVTTNGKKYMVKLDEIVLDYNEDELLKDILNKYENKNILQRFVAILFSKKESYAFNIKLNKEVLESKLNDISSETGKDFKEPSVVIEGDNIKYLEGEKGEKLDIDNIMTSIQNGMKEEKLYTNGINISGIYIDSNPSINIDELKKVKDKISTYSTSYTPGGGRGLNVELAAKKIDDLILMPGDEFSYEKSVGPVSEENGYTYANVISNGEFVQGIGGGVCQVSSTLYNTQLNAGILPTERRNHSKPVGYVPKGLDATLASGSIDYKFENTYEYPIVINTNTSNGKLTIEFWSNNEVLQGIEYKPVGYSDGNIANTYLYGYDKHGKQVYEKHIDTSVYR
ncbi:MAG: VanW family protein [Peptostreptococcaceae bacterium]